MHPSSGPVPRPFLQLEGVSKRFGKAQVLRDVDLSVTDGEFLCFLGPSGCGKSTLLRIVAGLEAESGGRILKQGADISGAAPAQRDIGILFQSYALFPNLSVYDNVAYGLVNRGMRKGDIRQRVEELLALVGLPDTARRFPGQLSGGQQQRIALARALAPSPGLLLLDEPLSALDAKVRLHLRQQIRELQRSLRLTTIMVTHDQEEALTMADRIMVMHQGTIEQIGTPLEVYHRPASRFVADFVGKMNFLSARFDGADTVRAGNTVFRHNLAGVARGADLTLGFRPEDVCSVEDVSPSAANRFQATVRAVEFLGLAWRAMLASPTLCDGEILADFSSADARRLGLEPGKQLQLSVEPEHLHIFAADGKRVQ
jgi:iron(III) transport system ATP-binding protein